MIKDWTRFEINQAYDECYYTCLQEDGLVIAYEGNWRLLILDFPKENYSQIIENFETQNTRLDLLTNIAYLCLKYNFKLFGKTTDKFIELEEISNIRCAICSQEHDGYHASAAKGNSISKISICCSKCGGESIATVLRCDRCSRPQLFVQKKSRQNALKECVSCNNEAPLSQNKI